MYGPLGFALLHSGDTTGCVDLLTEALDGLASVHVAPLAKIWWYVLLAEATATLNRYDDAAEWARRAEEHVGPWTPPRRRGSAHVARAYALMAADPVAAFEQARIAVELFATAGDPVRHAQARMLVGTALNATGSPDLAHAEFAGARALFDSAGATLFVMRALREESRTTGTTGAPRPSV